MGEPLSCQWETSPAYALGAAICEAEGRDGEVVGGGEEVCMMVRLMGWWRGDGKRYVRDLFPYRSHGVWSLRLLNKGRLPKRQGSPIAGIMDKGDSGFWRIRFGAVNEL